MPQSKINKNALPA